MLNNCFFVCPLKNCSRAYKHGTKYNGEMLEKQLIKDIKTITSAKSKIRTKKYSLSGERPVPPISVSVKILESPLSLLKEDLVCGRWVPRPAAEVVFAVLSRISWFSSWVNVEACTLRVLSWIYPPFNQLRWNHVDSSVNLLGVTSFECVAVVFYVTELFRMSTSTKSLATSKSPTVKEKLIQLLKS